MAEKTLPLLADERPQLVRWIGVTAEGHTFPTSREHAAGFELSEPYTDVIPPMPASYRRDRKSEPK